MKGTRGKGVKSFPDSDLPLSGNDLPLSDNDLALPDNDLHPSGLFSY